MEKGRRGTQNSSAPRPLPRLLGQHKSVGKRGCGLARPQRPTEHAACVVAWTVALQFWYCALQEGTQHVNYFLRDRPTNPPTFLLSCLHCRRSAAPPSSRFFAAAKVAYVRWLAIRSALQTFPIYHPKRTDSQFASHLRSSHRLPSAEVSGRDRRGLHVLTLARFPLISTTALSLSNDISRSVTRLKWNGI